MLIRYRTQRRHTDTAHATHGTPRVLIAFLTLTRAGRALAAELGLAPFLFSLPTIAGPAALRAPSNRLSRLARTLGPLGAAPLPSKWQIEVGEPMDAAAFAAAQERDGRGTPALEAALRDRVRALVARGLSARGSAWR